jgi:hypothetical protein
MDEFADAIGMSGQLQWWVTPVALLVMTGVLGVVGKLPTDPGVATPAGKAPITEDVQAISAHHEVVEVIVKDANGLRKSVSLGPDVLVLVLPAACRNQRIEVTLWRRLATGREDQAWMNLRPLVRSDARLPMAGIVPGIYDIEVSLPGMQPMIRQGVSAPCEVCFSIATAVR